MGPICLVMAFAIGWTRAMTEPTQPQSVQAQSRIIRPTLNPSIAPGEGSSPLVSEVPEVSEAPGAGVRVVQGMPAAEGSSQPQPGGIEPTRPVTEGPDTSATAPTLAQARGTLLGETVPGQQPTEQPSSDGRSALAPNLGDQPILTVTNLAVLTRQHRVVEGISFVVNPGERIGLVGPSGSGKSVTAQAVAGLLPTHLQAEGTIAYHRAVLPASLVAHLGSAEDSVNIVGTPDRVMAPMRGHTVAMIFQDPKAALNPLHRVGDTLASAFGLGWFYPNRRRSDVVRKALDEVGLDPAYADRRPHELSGGQCQRIGIALALAKSPALLIADEPTTALDALTQAQIMALLRQRLDATNAALIFISHDHALTRTIVDNGLVMRKGRVFSRGAIGSVLPGHGSTSGADQNIVEDRPGKAASPLTLDSLTDTTSRTGTADLADTAGSVGVVSPPDTTYRTERMDSEDSIGAIPVGQPHPADAADGSRSGAGDNNGAATMRVRADQHSAAVILDQVSRTHRGAATPTLDHIDLVIPKGAKVGIVGASGAGKTTLIRLIAGLNRPTSGHVTVNGRVQMVFQHPKASFNPRLRIGQSLEESLLDAHPGLGSAQRAQRIAEVLHHVDMDREAAQRFPVTFSGGQLQRLAIARAVLGEADILIADEPVSALDTFVRTQVLNLLALHGVQRTLVMVSHDFAPVKRLCDLVVVMAAGRIVEMGPVEAVTANPKDPYTAKLLAATAYQLPNTL